MSILNEVKRGSEIGKDHYHNYIGAACPKCGKERWLRLDHTKELKYTGLCVACSAKTKNFQYHPRRGEEHWYWKGGRIVDHCGYIRIKTYPNNFFYPMADQQNYVFEHRLIMAKRLGRCLHRWEIVHHKGTKYPSGSRENRSDNRIENLQLVSDDGHKQITIMEKKIEQLEQKIRKLENEKRQNQSH